MTMNLKLVGTAQQNSSTWLHKKSFSSYFFRPLSFGRSKTGLTLMQPLFISRALQASLYSADNCCI